MMPHSILCKEEFFKGNIGKHKALWLIKYLTSAEQCAYLKNGIEIWIASFF